MKMPTNLRRVNQMKMKKRGKERKKKTL